MEILSCKNLTFSYKGSQIDCLKNVSFGVDKGSLNLIMGKSGCGKTTLLKLLKKEISPCGNLKGEIKFSLQNLTPFSIGFVMQNPDSQTVTDKVMSELCFGLENMGIQSDEINRRVAETVSFFGIENLMERDISTLSGGQKQLVNLCAVMTMRPEILILDEPTGQLDPISASNFFSTVLRLNTELGITVIIAEHNCEEIFSACDKIILMENGTIISEEKPYRSAKNIDLWKDRSFMLPTSAQLWINSKKKNTDCPLTVKEGKNFAEKNFSHEIFKSHFSPPTDEVILTCNDLWFRYEKNLPDIIKGADFSLFKGEIFSLLGSNGVGKSTFLKVLGGLEKAYSGKIKVKNKNIKAFKNGTLHKNLVGFLPQNPYDMFVKETVEDDFKFVLNSLGKTDCSIIEKLSKEFEISHLLCRHPLDLSGGEAQKCAIARLLISEPEIILMDEPVKGMDAENYLDTEKLMKKLKAEGISILAVTHNIEFAAGVSDRCGMFFNGKIISSDTPEKFFCSNNFYTTFARRITREIFENVVTTEQAVNCIKKSEEKEDEE